VSDIARTTATGRALDHERRDRVARIIGGVVKEALRSTGTRAVVLLDAESPEGELLTEILERAGIPLAEYSDPTQCLTAHPATKTTLLAGTFFPRADLFPLGDLYATQVRMLIGDCTEDPGVAAAAAATGGLERLDELLTMHIDQRVPLADRTFDQPPGARTAITEALARTRFRRRSAALVPKLSPRTIGTDLLD
jgi:hypothetical protein